MIYAFLQISYCIIIDLKFINHLTDFSKHNITATAFHVVGVDILQLNKMNNPIYLHDSSIWVTAQLF